MNEILFRVCRRDSAENEPTRRRKLKTSSHVAPNATMIVIDFMVRIRFWFWLRRIVVLVWTQEREKNTRHFSRVLITDTGTHTRVPYNRKYSYSPNPGVLL